MVFLRIVKTVVFLCLINSLFAQNVVDPNVKLATAQNSEVEKRVFDITSEQMIAIQQIEMEFAVREERKKETDENFLAEQPKRALEREEKIRNILSPEQWIQYQEFRRGMIQEEKRMLEERK